VTDPPDQAPERRRGLVWLYSLAFLLVIGSAVAFTASATGFLESTRLLWLSTGLSAAAIAFAVIGVLLPRRR
jgi:uncharacterized membrane protein